MSRWRCGCLGAALLLALLLLAPPASGDSLRRRLTQSNQDGATAPSSNGGASNDCCARLAAAGFTSELPVVVIDSGGKPIARKEDTDVKLCTCNSGASFQDYLGPATAAVRGTSSANFTKKSFKVALKSAAGGKATFPFLGMPEDDDWILYGDELDRTLGMRNYLSYNLARASGRYATRTVWVEVFLVLDGAPLGEQHYNGLYIAEEKVKKGKQRVDVAKLTPPDLSGGYVFLYDNDNIEEGDKTFGPLPAWEHPFIIKDPKDVPDGGAFLLSYLSTFQAALEAPDWLARTSSASYTSFIDAPDFTDFFLLVELSKNPDGYRGSTYMHKERGGPLAMGPAWDYNEAYGMCCGYPIDGWQRGGQSGPGVSGGSAVSPEGWRFNICDDPGRCLVEPTDGTSRWYRRMWQDPRFRQAAAMRWAQLRTGPWSDAALKGLVATTTARIKPAALRNYARFAAVLLPAGSGSGEAEWTAAVGQVQDWLLKRVGWMDGAFPQAAAASSAAPSAAGGR